MKYKIELVSNDADFYTIALSEILPGHAPFKNMNSLMRQISPDTPKVTTATINAFFKAGGIMAVATTRGQLVVGIAHLIFTVKSNATTGRIEHVGVSAKHRKRGLAREMTRLLIGKARERDVRYLDLTTGIDNAPARKLYESLGFVERESVPYRLTF